MAMTRLLCKAGFAVVFAAAGEPALSAAPAQTAGTELHVPASIAAEHRDIRTQLDRLREAAGRTGGYIREVAALLQPHLRKEEELALPVLGLLPGLAAGTFPADVQGPLRLVNRFKAEMPAMLDENRRIRIALQELDGAARSEGDVDAVRLAARLMDHAEQEEEILYPGVMLVGEYLRLSYNARAGR